MWLKNFYNELKAWRIIRKVYKENKSEFEKIGLKKDWFGRLWLVINRDPKIPLGSAEDEELLGNELHIISDFLFCFSSCLKIVITLPLPQYSSA